MFDEINWAYAGLSLAAGFIAWFASSRVPDVNRMIPIFAAVGGVVLAYVYLSLTDRG